MNCRVASRTIWTSLAGEACSCLDSSSKSGAAVRGPLAHTTARMAQVDLRMTVEIRVVMVPPRESDSADASAARAVRDSKTSCCARPPSAMADA
jgi:hypothetical protein